MTEGPPHAVALRVTVNDVMMSVAHRVDISNMMTRLTGTFSRRARWPVTALTLCAVAACGHGDNSLSAPKFPGDTTHHGGMQYYDVAKLGVPKFVNSIYIDLSQLDSSGKPVVEQISKFRSSSGHDYSDSFERCRSMKHYFGYPDRNTKLYIPVTGTVSMVNPDTMSGGIYIQSDAQPAFTFMVFHPRLAKVFVVGEHVVEGQYMGTHVGNYTGSDIAVLVTTENAPSVPHGGPDGTLVSYFETLTDSGFLPLKKRGINSPADLIISKADRDANPLTCETQAWNFTNADSDPLAQVVKLK